MPPGTPSLAPKLEGPSLRARAMTGPLLSPRTSGTLKSLAMKTAALPPPEGPVKTTQSLGGIRSRILARTSSKPLVKPSGPLPPNEAKPAAPTPVAGPTPAAASISAAPARATPSTTAGVSLRAPAPGESSRTPLRLSTVLMTTPLANVTRTSSPRLVPSSPTKIPGDIPTPAPVKTEKITPPPAPVPEPMPEPEPEPIPEPVAEEPIAEAEPEVARDSQSITDTVRELPAPSEAAEPLRAAPDPEASEAAPAQGPPVTRSVSVASLATGSIPRPAAVETAIPLKPAESRPSKTATISVRLPARKSQLLKPLPPRPGHPMKAGPTTKITLVSPPVARIIEPPEAPARPANTSPTTQPLARVVEPGPGGAKAPAAKIIEPGRPAAKPAGPVSFRPLSEATTTSPTAAKAPEPEAPSEAPRRAPATPTLRTIKPLMPTVKMPDIAVPGTAARPPNSRLARAGAAVTAPMTSPDIIGQPPVTDKPPAAAIPSTPPPAAEPAEEPVVADEPVVEKKKGGSLVNRGIIYATAGSIAIGLICLLVLHFLHVLFHQPTKAEATPAAATTTTPAQPIVVPATTPAPQNSAPTTAPTQPEATPASTPASTPTATATPSPTPAPASTPAPAAPTPPPPAPNPQLTDLISSGLAKQKTGDLDGAIAAFTQAIAIDPNFVQGYTYRAAVRQAKGDLDGAMTDDDEILTLLPSNASAFCQRGFLKQSKGDLDGAVADYSRAIQIDPKSYIAYYNRGLIEDQKGNFDAAISDYNQTLALNPQLPGAYYNRGNAKSEKADFDGAIADYTRALEIDPKLALAYCNRALAEQQTGNLDAAFADYNQALSADPTIPIAYYNRGLIKEQRNDLDGAIADTTKAIELNPNSAQAYYNRGVALQARGNLDAAANDLRKFIELAPKDAYADYARLYLWVITSQLGQSADSDRTLAQSLETNWNADPEGLPSRIASFLLGHITETDLLTAASSPDMKKDQGQHCEVWYFDGVRKLLAGDKAGAIDCFRRCTDTGQKDFCEYILAQAQLQALVSGG
jgi:tetratricopeptide (TPR) repeat protein